MTIEQRIAVQVFDAKCRALPARDGGKPEDASEVVIHALAELWQFAPYAANEIADHWVIWDIDGRPWPRESAFGENVVRMTDR